ncbi:MAG: response regulator transcription factor [Parasporobacterium sp.]|nr:response regulator transcription factor [Parasporobacterium sp.]
MKVLIVEDDINLSDTIKQILTPKYSVEQAFDGYEGYSLAHEDIYDAIILDIMMPQMDGYEVLRKLRNDKNHTPILMLTAKDSIESKIQGFDYGADDYLTKPFLREELLARLDALIRRSIGSYATKEISFYDLKLNLSNREVTIGNERLNIQGKQFDMLEYLINSKNSIVTKEQIFNRIWGYDSETVTNVVEVYASGIRKELKKYDYDRFLKTVRGVGYMLSESKNG